MSVASAESTERVVPKTSNVMYADVTDMHSNLQDIFDTFREASQDFVNHRAIAEHETSRMKAAIQQAQNLLSTLNYRNERITGSVDSVDDLINACNVFILDLNRELVNSLVNSHETEEMRKIVRQMLTGTSSPSPSPTQVS